MKKIVVIEFCRPKMFNEKDRSQLLQMAGNIAGGICSRQNFDGSNEKIAEISAHIAWKTMQAVDKLIAEQKEEPKP